MDKPEVAPDNARAMTVVQSSGSARAGREGANGLAVLVLLVVVGIGSGAAYFHYKEPRLESELQAQLAAAPKTAQGRLEAWHRAAAPNIHHRLTKFARFSDEMPWIVTHARYSGVVGGDEEPEIWGIDCTELPRELARLEDMTVIVELPAPRLLGRRPLAGDQASFVPKLGAGESIDAHGRLADLATYFLEGIPGALAEDIEGARLEVRIRDSESSGPQ